MEGGADSVITSSGLEWENLALYTSKPMHLGFSSSSGGLGLGLGPGPNRSFVYEDTMRMLQPDPTIGHYRGGGRDAVCFSGPSNVMTSSSSSIPLSSTITTPTPTPTPAKRSRASYHNMQNPCCQVEGCNLDLKLAKDYHRRHRICESHSKSPKVIVAGMERRFCQQCSRFHDLSEFDDKKRSCRRRLSDHNARRRRVQPESIQPGISPALFAEPRQQGVLLNGLPVSLSSSSWENACSTMTFKPSKSLNDDVLHMDHRSINPRIFDQCLHVGSTNPSMGPEMSAHSLLSSSSWSLSEAESTSMEGINVQGSYINGLDQLHSTNMQEYQLFKPSYPSGNFYSTQRTL